MDMKKKIVANPLFVALLAIMKALTVPSANKTDFVPWINHSSTDSTRLPPLFNILTVFLTETPNDTKLSRFISRDPNINRGPSDSGNYYYTTCGREDIVAFQKQTAPYIKLLYEKNADTLMASLDGIEDFNKSLLVESSKTEYNNFDDLKIFFVDSVLNADYTPCGKPPSAKKKPAEMVTPDMPAAKSTSRVFCFSEDVDPTMKRFKAAGWALLKQPVAAQQSIHLGTFLERSSRLRNLQPSTPLSPPTKAALAQIQAGRIFRVMKNFGKNVSNAKDRGNCENNTHDQNAGPSHSD